MFETKLKKESKIYKLKKKQYTIIKKKKPLDFVTLNVLSHLCDSKILSLKDKEGKLKLNYFQI